MKPPDRIRSTSLAITSKADRVNARQAYSEFVARKILFIAVSFAILLLLAILSACTGGAKESWTEVFHSILSRCIPSIDSDPFVESIVWHLRLPRILMGIVAGSGLGVAGAVMQAVTRNPLVSPFTVGISSAAAFGASMAIMFGIGYVGVGTYIIILSAFISALGCGLLVFFISRLKRSSPEVMVLAGIALTYFFGSLTAILQFFANEQQLNAMVNWTFGTLSGADWHKLTIITGAFLLSMPVFIRFSWDLNIMFSGGDEAAKSLGINVAQVRNVALLLSSFITAAIVCFTGIIGFVGLVAPHVGRMVLGSDHRFLLPASCVVGSILVIGADIVGRTILAPVIIPIGIVISFVGVPMFLYLMVTRDSGWD
ncbi:FecCD family ABC transporter permease [Methanothrix thermoacetophila]|uniref:Cobalamin import system permease protein BtuC n=1 Tax=Methanothrix thermoacetophila (strain DSM 6194 / JCM 14653 / NBRC 101360 / PT) TaxID=349307 RepID=A0B8E4_METTP|nr:iron ABC transporter permease [Methanothrix thermoacetophila]ABK14968.1 transport system permease protein [Methanothrix thermoacetophila PT]